MFHFLNKVYNRNNRLKLEQGKGHVQGHKINNLDVTWI